MGQNLQCLAVFNGSHKAPSQPHNNEPNLPSIIDTRENLNEGRAVLYRLVYRQKERLGGLPIKTKIWDIHNPSERIIVQLLGAVSKHSRTNSNTTTAFFARGGPLRMGLNESEMDSVLKKILNQPEGSQYKNLEQLWANLNVGGHELFNFYQNHNFENKKFYLSLSDGPAEEATFVKFDARSGYVLIKFHNSEKLEWVPGATFYERLSYEQRQNTGMTFSVLPESEWFRSLAKIKAGKNGALFTAALKPESEVPQRRSNSFNVFAEFSTRQYANGMYPETRIPVLAKVISVFSNFANIFKFKILHRNGMGLLQYPDINLIGEIQASLPKDRKSPVKLISTAEFESVPLLQFAKAWAYDGALFMAEQGTGHFHDLSLHFLAYFAIPPEIALANRAHIAFWLELSENSQLMKNRSLEKFVQNEIRIWAEGFDTLTGRFVDSLYRKDLKDTFDERIKTFLEKLNLRSGKDAIETYYQNPTAPWAVGKLQVSAEEMAEIRAMRLLAEPVPKEKMPAQVERAKAQLFLSN